MKIFTDRKNAKRGGYTLIEALVSSIVLMMGISAASQLTLTLITQEEINGRTTTAMNYHQNAAQMYRQGFSILEIEAVIPADPVIETLTITEDQHDLGGGLGFMDYADITIEYHPSPASQTWVGGDWSGGSSSETKTNTIRVFRSLPPIEVD